jgi:putative transposase
MILAHKIRLDPTPRQEDYFRRACGTARFTYNWALAAWKTAYEAGEKPSGRALKKQFNAVRGEEYPWSREVHRDCTARPFDDLQNAFQHFFRRVKAGQKPGYPQFKKKGKCEDSFYAACDMVAFDGRRVRIPRLGWVKMREALRFEGKVLGVTVSRTADRWDIAVQVDVGEVHKEWSADGVVGVDLGIKTFATLSTGEKIDGPKALRKNIKRLQRLSRRHSRKVRGSNGRKKSAMNLARLHARIANVRKDHLDKLTTNLCHQNQAVGIEDLHVKGMVRNRKLARAINDEGWGQFRWMLSYKAPMYGTEIVVADRWFPSSKACSACGNVVEKLPLSVREWACPACGVTHDRDLNAAKNLEPKHVPLGKGELTPVETEALADPSGPVKLRLLKPESSSRSPEMVAV